MRGATWPRRDDGGAGAGAAGDAVEAGGVDRLGRVVVVEWWSCDASASTREPPVGGCGDGNGMRACAETAIMVCEGRLRQRVSASLAGASVEPPGQHDDSEI
jgi:hypothetical protein